MAEKEVVEQAASSEEEEGAEAAEVEEAEAVVEVAEFQQVRAQGLAGAEKKRRRRGRVLEEKEGEK